MSSVPSAPHKRVSHKKRAAEVYTGLVRRLGQLVTSERDLPGTLAA